MIFHNLCFYSGTVAGNTAVTSGLCVINNQWFSVFSCNRLWVYFRGSFNYLASNDFNSLLSSFSSSHVSTHEASPSVFSHVACVPSTSAPSETTRRAVSRRSRWSLCLRHVSPGNASKASGQFLICTIKDPDICQFCSFVIKELRHTCSCFTQPEVLARKKQRNVLIKLICSIKNKRTYGF